MKLTTKFFALALGVSLLGIGACKDSTTEPTPSNGTYLITTQGSYWVYESYETDSTGAQVAESRSVDSTTVVGKKTILGKEAAIFEHNMDGSKDSTFMYSSGTKIYSYENLDFGMLVDSTMNLGSQWVQTADLSSGTSWTAKDTTVTVQYEVSPGVNLPVQVRFMMTGQNKGTTNVQIGSTTKKAFDILNTVKISVTGDIIAPITFSSHSYYVENIGLVKVQNDPVKIPTFGINGNAQTMTLLRYNIK